MNVLMYNYHCIPMTSYFKGTDNGVNPIHRGINDPKRPFRITIIRRHLRRMHLVFFPCFWEYMVGSPNSGRFLIADAWIVAIKFLFANRFRIKFGIELILNLRSIESY